jgi:glucosyl-3-phosphoglycerate phosphatase
MTTRLLLVRHGRTAYNAEIRFMGQLDVPMDELGQRQVQAVAKRLAS